ncbi:MAG: metal ABC transporter substrate-binding protein, partial [Promicromonosporaceae bacterium]|nr:metal ABC transporter substrate-binding protein [Promicromonosporaceae bacterium]
MIIMFIKKQLARVGAAIATVFGLTLALAACGDSTPQADSALGETGHLTVVTSFYPLQFVAQQVAGDLATVINLTPPAADPHDLELSMAAANQINTADLVVILTGFQPAVDQAVEVRNPARLIDVVDYVALLAPGDDGDDHAHEDHDHSADDHTDDHDHVNEYDSHAHDHSIGGYDPHFWLDPTKLAQ